jgi:hypothetical protein
VASESTPPPTSSGGAKYAILGVALFAIAGLVYCLTSSEEAPSGEAAAGNDAGVAARPTSLDPGDLDIPELPPDAGPVPDAGEAAATKRPVGTTRSWDECSGEIAAADARRVISEFNTQIRNCYERQLKQNPVLQGNMILAVRVGADGRVGGTQLSGSLHDRDVFACVRNVASHMRFPPPGGRDCAIVQVPYTMTPQR